LAYSYPLPPYCQAPGLNPSEDTNGLKLEFLQILTRHGDRTPTWTLPIEVVWNCTLNSLSIPSNDFTNQVPDTPRLYRKSYLPNRNVLPGDCMFGQLTSLGAEQHLQLGNQFRSLYVDEYQFLPEFFDPNVIYVRSTDVPRTIQSVQANLYSFFPPQNSTNGEINVIDIHTMDQYMDDMTPNPNICPALNNANNRLMNTSEYKVWNNTVYGIINYIAKVYNVSDSDLPDISGLWDAFGARMCHNKYIPQQISYSMLQDIEYLTNYALNYLWSDYEYGRLGSGMLLQEINDRILEFLKGESKTLLVYYSGHDSTVGPLMGTLGFTNGWPPYASHVEIELWSDSHSNYFVQVKYNGQSYQLPGCSAIMCPLDQFEAFVSTRIPTDFDKECDISS